ncbi:hypothetical protein [Acinetobacter radioresistens]|nr:hypothetical protein [Acinetobacter radioresistens]
MIKNGRSSTSMLELSTIGSRLPVDLNKLNSKEWKILIFPVETAID